MRNGARFSNLVYEYFYLRFKFQYYTDGDTLPSIDTLCRGFNMSAQTVTSALRLLRAEGYISMHNGQNTTVLYHQDERDTLAFGIRFFSERWNAYPDLYRTFVLLFTPMLVEGLRRMDGEELALVRRLAERDEGDGLFQFYCLTVQKLDNPLAMNLFWECSLFLGFPYVKKVVRPDRDGISPVGRRLRRIVSLAEQEDWERVRDAVSEYQNSDLQLAVTTLRGLVRPVPEEEQVVFRWRIYRDRPQLCYDLAAQLLHQIYLGKYRRAGLLPPYAALAEENGVSVSTVRRTIHMLNQIGATQTINGRGTQVFPLGACTQAPQFGDPLVRRNLSYFLQSFELVLYSCKETAGTLFSGLSEAGKADLIAALEAREGGVNAGLWYYLLAVSRHSSLAALREVYTRIYSLFLWGYPLKASSPEDPALERALTQLNRDLASCIASDDAEGCAAALNGFLTRYFPATERYLVSHGLQPEELRMTPGIRPLWTEG